MSRLSKIMSVDEIYSTTQGGLEIFKKEIEGFTLGKNIKNPFVSKDNNPSARVKQSTKSGLYLLYTYNDSGKYYTAIDFIVKKYNYTFNQAIEHILNGLPKEGVIVEKEVKIVKKQPILYEFEPIKFTDKHKEYYCCSLDEEFLNKEMNIWAVGKYAINKNVKYPPKNSIMFAYEHIDINGKPSGKVKFLTVGKSIDKKDKWKTNLNNSELWYLYKIKPTDKTIFILKSNKDASIMWKLGLPSIATQSENSAILSQNIPKLKSLFPNSEFCVVWGSDKQGVEECTTVTKEHNLKYFNTPKKFLSVGINDPFAYTKEFGIENFKRELKKKGLYEQI